VLSVTADTNVYISAFNYRGKPRLLIDIASAGLVQLDVSEPIIQETIRVLRDKFKWPEEGLMQAEAQMRRLGKYVTPRRIIETIHEDPADNRIVECAVEAKSDYIVTGDKDFLRRGKVAEVPVLTVAEFLELVNRDRQHGR
jgi:putative PIN family toxin of toxin-antitoxin system